MIGFAGRAPDMELDDRVDTIVRVCSGLERGDTVAAAKIDRGMHESLASEPMLPEDRR